MVTTHSTHPTPAHPSGLMLRDGRLSARALQRMLAHEQQAMAGFIIGAGLHCTSMRCTFVPPTTAAVPAPCTRSSSLCNQHHPPSIQCTPHSCAVAICHPSPPLPSTPLPPPIAMPGCEVEQPDMAGPQQPWSTLPEHQRRAVDQLSAVLLQLPPAGLVGGWWGTWSAAAGPSCRIIMPPPPPPPPGQTAEALASTADGQSQQAPSGREGVGPVRCSLGQSFLQDYLDSLGALNTFG